MPRHNHRSGQQFDRRQLFVFSILAIALIGTLSIFGCGKMGGANSIHVKSARKGGADVKSWLDRSMLSGEVKVTSASADEIGGDVDLTSGDSSIKGSFTAKVLKRK